MSLRERLFGAFAKCYNIQMDEAIEESFNAYPSLSALFNRELKDFVRPIHGYSLVILPKTIL